MSVMNLSISGVPKVIYSLWLQGQDAAPPLVRLNFARWAALNPGYRLRILDRTDVDALLAGVELPLAHMTFQALSNVARTRLLLDGGGIWVDASLFPVRPLDDWLGEALTESGFFAFERPGPDRPISNWFLVASPQNLILEAMWRELRRYWSRPRRLVPGTPADPVACVSPAGAAASDEFPYYWFHYLFQYLLETEPEFAASWRSCAKYPADDPHRLQFLFRDDPAPPEAAIEAALRSAPVHKLDWRAPYPLELLESLA